MFQLRIDDERGINQHIVRVKVFCILLYYPYLMLALGQCFFQKMKPNSPLQCSAELMAEVAKKGIASFTCKAKTHLMASMCKTHSTRCIIIAGHELESPCMIVEEGTRLTAQPSYAYSL